MLFRGLFILLFCGLISLLLTMHLGFVLILAGAWLLLGSLSPLMGVALFVIVTDRWYISFEEKAMKSAFGEDYEAYRRRTRRWI